MDLWRAAIVTLLHEKHCGPYQRRRRPRHERGHPRRHAQRPRSEHVRLRGAAGFSGPDRRPDPPAQRARRRRHHPPRRHVPRQRALEGVSRGARPLQGAAQPRFARHRGAGGDRRQRVADRLVHAEQARLSGGRRRLHDRQRPVRHQHHHRQRHRRQRHARGDRPPAHHRLLAQSRVPGRDDGTGLRLPCHDGGSRRRRRGHLHARGSKCRRARSPSGCAPPTSAARRTRSW